MKGRILHLQKSAGMGGAEKHLTLLLPALVKAGFEIHYLIAEPPQATRLNDSLISFLSENGVLCYRVSMPWDLHPVGLWKMFRLVHQIQPDILHTHLIQGDFYGALYKSLYPQMKLISTRHGYDEDYQARFDLDPDQVHQNKNIYYWISRFSALRANSLIGISEGISRLTQALCGDSTKVRTIVYGYESRSDCQASSQPAYLYYIGRLIPFKHPEDLAEAYVLYRRQGGNLSLRIAGSGPSEQKMKAILKAAGYLDDVTFYGRIPNPEQYLSEAACLCVSSHSEGFGLVALEAMNAAIPILAYDVPALNEIVVHGETGILCPKGNTEAFAQGMLKFENQIEYRLALGLNGKRRLEDVFNLPKLVESISQIYSVFLNKNLI
jgi:glycosyltransferase involved in cell wall biosynthesis